VAAHAALLDEDDPRGAVATRPSVPATGPDVGPAPVGVRVPEHPVPSQLPADVASFTGRDEHLRQLDSLLAELTSSRTKAVVISTVSGTAGVGKTALAVHFAHRVRHRFPDGQLHVDLRWFGPSGSVVSAAEAVRGFLDAFGVPAERIPASLHAQAALYRSLLADRRVLVLLDNARDAEHVRPLLPGSPGCLVLVTSRNQLTSLVATDGANPVTLDLLSAAEARVLLARRLGPERVAAEPAAVDEIITLCARLPLALAIVAARAATRPDFPLAALADELRADGGLDALTADDPTSDVRTVFSWSYHALTPDAARLFRLLGLHPGPDITAPAAASLTGAPVADVRPLLAELVRTHLITERSPGRYVCHDLLHSYATELAHASDSQQCRHAALHRLLDYWVHTAYAADRRLDPHREQITLAPPQPGVAEEALADHDQALAWLTAEHPLLVAAVETALAAGFDTHAWQLAWAMTTFLERRGQWHDLGTVHEAALRAGERLRDARVRANAHRRIAHFRIWFDRDSAEAHLRQALQLYRDLGDECGQARIHLNLAVVCERRGQHDCALDHAERARGMFERAGERAGQADACNAVGWYSAHVGDRRHEDALGYCQEALRLYKEVGDEKGESHAWDSLGYINNLLGRPQEAIGCYRRALALRRKLGDRYFEARALESLGDIQRDVGELGSARDAWREALVILDAFGHPDAHQIRAKLHRAGASR
jgi:tetratricopeptide (TPR) repeat protein